MILARSIFDQTYSPNLLPMLQTLLSTLADIDFAHECALERLQASAMAEPMKARRAAQLEADHRKRREPWVRQAAELEALMSPVEPSRRAKVA